jgi:hypothetical protein
MPVRLAGGLQLTNQPQPSRLLHPEWPFRQGDRERFERLIESKPSLDVMVEAFVSPFRQDRSVTAIVPESPQAVDAIAAMFTPALDKGPIYGGVAVARNLHFQSYLVGAFAYHSGYLNPFERSQVFLLEHYLSIPLLVVGFALLLGAGLARSTERVRARRLAVGRT